MYTWGENKNGQLGLDEPLRNRSYATCVKCLQEETIERYKFKKIYQKYKALNTIYYIQAHR